MAGGEQDVSRVYSPGLSVVGGEQDVSLAFPNYRTYEIVLCMIVPRFPEGSAKFLLAQSYHAYAGSDTYSKSSSNIIRLGAGSSFSAGDWKLVYNFSFYTRPCRRTVVAIRYQTAVKKKTHIPRPC